MAAAAANASAPSLRQFAFFDAVPVKDIHDLASSPDIFKKTPEISTVISTSVGLLVADIHGSVFLLNNDFEMVKSWLAHTSGRVTHMTEQKGILITLGEEDSARHPFLKVWDLEKSEKKTGAPVLLRSTKVQSGNRPHPVSTMASSAGLAYLAVGLGDGTVLLYRHFDQSVFSASTSLTALPKPRVIHESPAEPVTGLGFKEPSEDSPNAHLFIVTTNHVLCYQASGKGSGAAPAVVHEVGCGLGCATMDVRAEDIVVARDEALYLCSPDGRGASYAVEGPKSLVVSHLNYIVVVSPPFAPSAGAASATVRNFVAKSPGPVPTDITKVTVFDLENKLSAYTGTFTEGVREVFSAWNKLYILSNDGKVLCLEEKSTATQLDMLYRKSLYPTALSLAKSQHLDATTVADIYRQYGDFLYSKGDYDNAMQQFVKTIGQVQASYVIRKFLDAQRIHNLVTYLQELHAAGLANADHTTLLLNTYTKLKDVTRLDSFIKREARRAVDGEKDELPFDLDTAIRVCRQAGYFEHASYLARKYERHEDYLRIQIEDAGNYKDALTYLRRLGAEAAEANLARHGRAMLDSLPEETTQLLIDLCTSLEPLTVEEEQPIAPPSRQASSTGPSYLSYLALNRAPAPTVSSDNATVRAADTVSRRDSLHDVSRTSTPPPATPTLIAPAPASAKAHAPNVRRPSPQLYFAHFIDHMEHFVRFLETVAQRRWGQTLDGVVEAFEADAEADAAAEARDQAAVWNTLLELYLAAPTGHARALRLLERADLPYDATHALMLCSGHGFTEGLVLLWERAGAHEDVLRFWMARDAAGDAGASAAVVRALAAYGAARPQLYPLVLRFLTSSATLLARHRDDLAEGQLDLPSVHFMCHHSYHQRCLGDQDTECPNCARAHGIVREIRRNNERLADQHGLFLLEVREGGFAALAGGFSRGALNLSRLEEVPT